MGKWWESLSELQKIFAYIAIPATFLLAIQAILSLVSLGDTDVNTDTDMDTDTDGGDISDIKLFSIKGIIAFCATFGWVGIFLIDKGFLRWIVILASLIAGFIAMFVIAATFYLLSKLQANGMLNLKNAVGNVGEVYLKIPENRKGIGKVSILIQGRLAEIDAVTDEEKSIPTGDKIRVIDFIEPNILLVVPNENFDIIKGGN